MLRMWRKMDCNQLTTMKNKEVSKAEEMEIEDLLARELDVLENAISDENRTLAICSREEIWKLIYRLVDSKLSTTRSETLKEVRDKIDDLDYFEKYLNTKNFTGSDGEVGYERAKEDVLEILTTII